jgi:hypothetical protein
MPPWARQLVWAGFAIVVAKVLRGLVQARGGGAGAARL